MGVYCAVYCAVWSCQAGDLSSLGRIWGFFGPKRRAPTLDDQRGGQASSRSKVGRGGSSRQLQDVQLDAARGSSVGPSF